MTSDLTNPEFVCFTITIIKKSVDRETLSACSLDLPGELRFFSSLAFQTFSTETDMDKTQFIQFMVMLSRSVAKK